MIQALPKGRYPALQQLEFECIKPHDADMPICDSWIQKQKQTKNFRKNEFFSKLFEYLPPNGVPNQQADEIVTKYFSCSLNSIFDKISKLPQRLFCCGFCKEPYFGPSQYILHCLELGCPINHNRSTYFFNFRSKEKKFSEICNEDIQKTLTRQEWDYFRSISLRKKRFFFTKFDVKPLYKDSSNFLYCGKCKWKTAHTKLSFVMHYIPHVIFGCKNRQYSTNSHLLTVLECKQNLIAFVEDIINFVINFNVITLFNNSYIRLEKNLKHQSQSRHTCFCANCNSNFPSEAQFIQHCLFECNSKTNPNSSHTFKRREVFKSFLPKKNPKTPQCKIQKSLQKVQKLEVMTLQKKKIEKEDPRPSEKWAKRLNPKFMEFQDHFQKILFCGSCFSHYQNDEGYLLHCLTMKCPLNEGKNSHFFFEIESEQALQLKNVEKFFETKKRANPESIKEYEFDENLKQSIRITKKQSNQLVKYGQKGNYLCGKCNQSYKFQNRFIWHCMNQCFSLIHQKNSHNIQFLKPSYGISNDDEFREFISSYLYAVQIMKLFPNKKYKITKNLHIDVDPDFLCGKCDTIFGNLYEYVLHSLEVCQNTKIKYSSHFIQTFCIKIHEEKIRWPLDVIFTQGFEQKTWKKQIQGPQIPLKNVGKPKKMFQTEKSQQDDAQKNKSISKKKLKNDIVDEIPEQKEKIVKEVTQNGQKMAFQVFLRPNIEYKADKAQYFCGECEILFKRPNELENHLRVCKNFEKMSSSHFLISNERFSEMYGEKIFSQMHKRQELKNFSKILCFNENFKCGCGQEGPLSKYAFHNRNKHLTEVQKGSSHIAIRIIEGDAKSKVTNVYLPVDLKGAQIDPSLKFFCPCDPWKKYQYSDFVKHIIKRHDGRSPKFWMLEK